MTSHYEENAPLPEIAWRAAPDLRNVADLARHMVHCRRASLLLPDLQMNQLQLVAASGFPTDAHSGAAIPFGQPVAGIVARTGQPLLVNGGQTFTNIVGQRKCNYVSSSFVSVPIPINHSQNGVLSAADPIGRDDFGDENLQAMQRLAGLIGEHLATASLRARLVASEARIVALQKEVIWLREAERSRLARDLHDEAGHALTLAIFHLDLERVKASAYPDAQEGLTRARSALLACSTALSEMAFRLRPRILEDLGLVSAIRALVAQAGSSGELQVEMRLRGRERSLGQSMELTVFRMVQEALTNVRKHAQADTASVELIFHDHALDVVVQDDGVGLARDDAFVSEYSSQGLRGMRERINALGGTLEILPRLRRGTCLRTSLPLPPRS